MVASIIGFDPLAFVVCVNAIFWVVYSHSHVKGNALDAMSKKAFCTFGLALLDWQVIFCQISSNLSLLAIRQLTFTLILFVCNDSSFEKTQCFEAFNQQILQRKRNLQIWCKSVVEDTHWSFPAKS